MTTPTRFPQCLLAVVLAIHLFSFQFSYAGNHEASDQHGIGAAAVNDNSTIFNKKYEEGLAKFRFGFYDDAIRLFKDCQIYFADNQPALYLNSIYYTALCLNRNQEYGMSVTYTALGMDEAQRLGVSKMNYYFRVCEGLNAYAAGNYRLAVGKLHTALAELVKKDDFVTSSLLYLYIGKAYWSMEQKDKAIYYFKQADVLFKTKGYIHPDLREAYEKLITYYREKEDREELVLYIDKLLKIDPILAKRYPYLNQISTKQYDSSALLELKSDANRNVWVWTSLTALLLLPLVWGILYLRKRKQQSAKNANLFEHEKNPDKVVTQDSISAAAEKHILSQLERFERERQYLEKDLTLQHLAGILDTNTRYVSLIINKHRDKGVVEYINDLKVDYVISLLTEQPKYRNYTHQALGEEVGFGSTQKFVRAFKAKTGVSPGVFVEGIER